MRVLFFTPEDQSGASSRLRCYQFLPGLCDRGIDCTVLPFINSGLKRHYFSSGSLAALLKFFFFVAALLRRFGQLLLVPSHDIVFIHRNIVPIGPELFAYLIKKVFRKPIIYDFDDAIYLEVSSKANRVIRKLKCNFSRTTANLRLADRVVAGNKVLAKFAATYNANVLILPTVIDPDQRPYSLPKIDNGERVTIGWIGGLGTTEYLVGLKNALTQVLERFPSADLCLIGFSGRIDLPRVKIVAWSLANEDKYLPAFDIGINPMPDNDFSRGKCGFKIIQYMGLGLPSLASPVGANNDIIVDGQTGFLPKDDAEWIEKLSLLLENKALRIKMGQSARKRAEERYSLAAALLVLMEVIGSCHK